MKIYWIGYSKNFIGPKLKELREKAGLSQEALAGKLSLRGTDFSALMILRIEKGQRFVPDYELLALAEYFGVSTDYLLGRVKKY